MRLHLILLFVSAFSCISHASFHAQPTASTEFPIGWSVGGIVGTEEMPVYARASYGGFIPAYTDAMNGVAEGFGFYDDSVSVLVSEGLASAVFWEAGVGFARSNTSGFYAELLYFYAIGDGVVTGQELFDAVAGVNIPSATNNYSLESEIHSLRVSLGYRWPIQERLILSVSGAIIKPFDSSTSVDRPTSGPVQEAILQNNNEAVDEFMKDIYNNDVLIPVIGAGLAYKF